MKNSKVSVIMSCYNSEKTNKFAIQSILSQTLTNFEFLIFDDGSSDNTLKIIESFDDNRICVFHSKENLGLTKRLNFLAQKATGQFIARQDSDDFSLTGRLQKQLKFLLSNDGYASCTSSSYLKNSINIHPRFSKYLPKKFIILFKNPFIHGALMIRSKDLKEVGYYNPLYKYSQDYKLYLDLYKKKKKIKFLMDPLYVLNLNGAISTENYLLQKFYKKKAIKSYLRFNS